MSNFKVGDKVWFKETHAAQSMIDAATLKGWTVDFLVVQEVRKFPYREDTVMFNFPGTDVGGGTSENNLILISVKNTLVECTQPSYYNLTIRGEDIDVFDISRGFNLPFTLSSALKYIVRVKGDTSKRINDLEKAIECIQREINYLKDES